MKLFLSPEPGDLQWRRVGGNWPRNADVSSPNTLTFTDIKDSNEGVYECYPNGRDDLAQKIKFNVDGKLNLTCSIIHVVLTFGARFITIASAL